MYLTLDKQHKLVGHFSEYKTAKQELEKLYGPCNFKIGIKITRAYDEDGSARGFIIHEDHEVEQSVSVLDV